jgi:outer membrane biosynthesis protein TonB
MPASFASAPLTSTDIIVITIGDIPPTPTPTQTETPTQTNTETSTPTNTETPTQTPTQTNTETPTSTPTPTPTPNYNITFINNSTNGIIEAFADNSGQIPLFDSTSSLPLNGGGQVLFANHGLTSNSPQIALNGTGSVTIQITINGDVLLDSQTVVPSAIGVTPGGVPLQASDVLIVTIGDIPPTPTPTQTETPTQTPTNAETQTPTPTNTQTPTHTPGINFTLINNTTGGTVNFDGFYDGTSTPISLLSIVSGGGYSTGFPVSGGTILYATHGTTPSGPYVDVNGGFANYVVKLNNVVIASGGAINPGIAVTGGSGLLSTDIVEVTITND